MNVAIDMIVEGIKGASETGQLEIITVFPRLDRTCTIFFQGFYCCAYYTRAHTDQGRALLFQFSASQLA